MACIPVWKDMKPMKKKIMRITALLLTIAVLAGGCGKAGGEASGKADGKAGGEVSGETGGEAQESGQNSAQNDVQDDVQSDAQNGTQSDAQNDTQNDAAENIEKEPDVTDTIPLNVIDDNYRTYYEVFVYSFCDSDGDGIGDLQGLISKLDYINDGDDTTDTDLGCNGIWLMPVNPSPTYHKYDVIDYYGIDEQYGSIEDFKELLAECDKRGIKVIMDLVLNHSSSQNPWFLEAYSYFQNLGDKEPDAAECPYIDYYHFTKEPAKGYYQVEGTDWYYEGMFWSEMPDFNLDCEALREEIAAIADYWLDMGVGGFRLDAVKEYYSGSPQSNIDFLSWLTDTVKSKKEDAYLVGEAWVGMDDYAAYYGSGMDSLFDFAFADSEGIIAKVLKGGSAAKYGSAITSLDELYGSYNENYIDAPFYTNHDMGRSAGYYAGENSEYQTKLAGAMNLFMSGSAFLYYGEELGMKGAGKDENKRAPMYWSMNPDADGMCDGPADMDDITMKFESLEEQEKAPDSVYHFFKKVIKVRNQNPEIARGVAEYVYLNSEDEDLKDTVCTIKKTYEGSEILIVFMTGAEKVTVDLSGITLNGKNVGADTEIRAMLTTGDEPLIFGEDGVAVMPAYSVLVLK